MQSVQVIKLHNLHLTYLESRNIYLNTFYDCHFCFLPGIALQCTAVANSAEFAVFPAQY